MNLSARHRRCYFKVAHLLAFSASQYPANPSAKSLPDRFCKKACVVQILWYARAINLCSGRSVSRCLLTICSYAVALSSGVFMRIRNILLLCIILLIATQSRVYAYTDPGSGTLLWQMLIAGSVGAMFYFRRLISWARSLKSRSKSDLSDSPKSE
jgi:hypothetical protein